MTPSIESLVRPNIRALKPYRSARQDHLTGLLLDANENSFGSVIAMEGFELNRYPDPFQNELRTRIAHQNAVPPERVFVGVGSDEVIDLLIRIFCEPRLDAILLLEPTYGMYRVAASIQDVDIRSCLLTKDFQIDLESTRKAVTSTTKLLFCCSPNNPTGNLLRRDDIRTLCRDLSVVVVVDEAYVDFSENGTAAPLLDECPNLVIMRTLSKAWGMAAIRLGYCLASPDIIGYLLKVKSPYNVNALTSRAALAALEMTDAARVTVAAIQRERERLAGALREFSFVRRVYPSDANFLLVRVLDAARLYDFLASAGIIVRNRSSEPGLANCLRITVGTPDDNSMLLASLQMYR